MNKYNVRAIRKDLDGFLRNRSWNKFHSKLKSLESTPEILKAVVLSNNPKQTSGSLLHAVVNNHCSCHPNILPSVTCMVRAAPESIFVQNKQLETPLHLAIDRVQCVDMIKLFLEIATNLEDNLLIESQQSSQSVGNGNILTMVDIYGDTPLLKASRVDASQIIRLLLQYDIIKDAEKQSSVLIERKRKGRTALWYVASNELQNTTKSKEFVVPKDLKLMLIAAYFALERRKGGEIIEEEWKELLKALCQETTIREGSSAVTQSSLDLSLTVRALISCGYLLGKYAVKLLDFVLASDIYRDYLSSQEIDSEGNYALHYLCSCEMTQSHDSATTISVISTNALLLEQILRQDGVERALSHSNHQGNMPLHLALASQQGYVRILIAPSPTASRHKNNRGELPLHVALKVSSTHVHLSTNDYLCVVDRLWQAYPGAVELRDGRTQLYPFQLVASSGWGQLLDETTNSFVNAIDENQTNTQTYVTHTSNEMWLTLIFKLLRAAPQII